MIIIIIIMANIKPNVRLIDFFRIHQHNYISKTYLNYLMTSQDWKFEGNFILPSKI